MSVSITSVQKKEQQVVLCADLGTSSIKAALITNTGDVLSYARIKLHKDNGSNRWLIALQKASKQLLDKVSAITIDAISISGNGPSLVNSNFSYLWDEPLHKSVIEKLATAKKDGHPCTSMFIPRLMHIKKTMPQIWKATETANIDTTPDKMASSYLFSLPEYLVFQLTGKVHTLLPNERYTTAYWTSESLKQFELNDNSPIMDNTRINNRLPPFKPLTQSGGMLTPTAAKKLNMHQKHSTIPVFCSGPDFTVALLGTGTVHAGDVCDRAGTSEGINLCTDRPLIADNILTLPSPINSLWNASCLSPNSGKRFSHEKHKNFLNASYLEYVQYLLQHQDNQGFKIMNEIAYDLKSKIDYLETIAIQNKMSFNTIVCTGGQSKNPEWMQFKANILNRTLYVPLCKDSELIGGAVVAFTALGCYSSMVEASSQLVKKGTIYTPLKKL